MSKPKTKQESLYDTFTVNDRQHYETYLLLIRNANDIDILKEEIRRLKNKLPK